MSLAIERGAFFMADFEIQSVWYVDKAGAGKSMVEFRESFSPLLRHIRVFMSHRLRPAAPYELAHLGAVELGTYGWVGTDRVIIRPALEGTPADDLPLG